MTAAEFRTLRDACGLSQQAAADLLAVHLNSVQGWESGRSRVPPGVANELRHLDARLERAVIEALDTWQDVQDKHGAADAVRLARYRTAAGYAGSRAGAEGLQHGVHGALIGRVATALRRAGATVEIAYAD